MLSTACGQQKWEKPKTKNQKKDTNNIRKRLHGAKLDGAKHFQKNCQNVPGAAGAAVGAAAGAAAASAVCIYYVIIGGAKYVMKCIQHKQQQPHQLQGHFDRFVENVQPHLAWPHVAFSNRRGSSVHCNRYNR